MLRTIPRNRTRQIAALKDTLTTCRAFTLTANFIAYPVDPAVAWQQLERGAKLTDHGTGKYTITVHSNHWYELTA